MREGSDRGRVESSVTREDDAKFAMPVRAHETLRQVCAEALKTVRRGAAMLDMQEWVVCRERSWESGSEIRPEAASSVLACAPSTISTFAVEQCNVALWSGTHESLPLLLSFTVTCGCHCASNVAGYDGNMGI